MVGGAHPAAAADSRPLAAEPPTGRRSEFMKWLKWRSREGRAVPTSRLTKHRDRREWALDGHEVTQLLVDNRFGLVVWWKHRELDNVARFVIEGPFTILKGDQVHDCDPDNTASLAPALLLFRKGVDSVAAHRDGLLRIRFVDQTELRVPKRQDGRETWESFGSGELHDIGMLCSSHDVAPWGGK